MKIGSLFSGIEGIGLGLERAGVGTLAWACEKDEVARRVLQSHWPGLRIYDDVRKIDRRTQPVDLICAGFPCQDLSAAGRQAGIHGPKSGLWFEVLRVVRELKPSWVVVENVGHTWRQWVPVVRGGLFELGFASVPLQLSAAEVGAQHLRKRVFVVAHADNERLRLLARQWQQKGTASIFDLRPSETRDASDTSCKRLESLQGVAQHASDAGCQRQLEPRRSVAK